MINRTVGLMALMGLVACGGAEEKEKDPAPTNSTEDIEPALSRQEFTRALEGVVCDRALECDESAASIQYACEGEFLSDFKRPDEDCTYNSEYANACLDAVPECPERDDQFVLANTCYLAYTCGDFPTPTTQAFRGQPAIAGIGSICEGNTLQAYFWARGDFKSATLALSPGAGAGGYEGHTLQLVEEDPLGWNNGWSRSLFVDDGSRYATNEETTIVCSDPYIVAIAAVEEDGTVFCAATGPNAQSFVDAIGDNDDFEDCVIL